MVLNGFLFCFVLFIFFSSYTSFRTVCWPQNLQFVPWWRLFLQVLLEFFLMFYETFLRSFRLHLLSSFLPFPVSFFSYYLLSSFLLSLISAWRDYLGWPCTSFQWKCVPRDSWRILMVLSQVFCTLGWSALCMTVLLDVPKHLTPVALNEICSPISNLTSVTSPQQCLILKIDLCCSPMSTNIIESGPFLPFNCYLL